MTDRPPVVAVDATAIPARLTGAGVYVAGMLAGLGSGGEVVPRVFAAPATVASLAAPGVRVTPVAAAGLGRLARIAWTQLQAGRAAAGVGADLLHGVHYELPLAVDLPAVVTVHDLTLVTHPEWHERTKAAYFGWAMRRAVRRARRVLCVSNSTATDAVLQLGVDPARIDVTPLGCDLEPAPAEAIAGLRRRLGLGGPYLLGLGTLEPRKDVPTLVRAFARLAGEVPHHLVVAGLAGWGRGEVADAVAASGVGDRIVLAGWIPEADKAALYTGADIFCYPSHYEGFGLPVLEAMACGVPVVTTRGGALAEVSGDAALHVAPGDPTALAGALSRALEDGSLRDRLIAAGRRQASGHTWARCATLTAAAYRKALEQDPA